MRKALVTLLGSALALAGCGKETPTLPAERLDQAAACSAIQAASEQEAVGAAGHLSAAAQERVLHYALLAGTRDGAFDDQVGNQVIQRTKAQFDRTVKGGWKTLRPACAAAFPAAAQRTPTLPAKADDRVLQCYVLAQLMRQALGQYEGRYNEDTVTLGVLSDKLDLKVGALAKRDGLKDEALAARKAQALAAAAALGQPPAVLEACGKAR